VSIIDTLNRESPSKRKEKSDGQKGKPKPHEMGLKVPIVFIPKCRRKVLYGQLKKELLELFHGLARHKECWIKEGHMMGDHVHMLISIPPKYLVSQVIGYIEGKSAIHLARVYGEI